MIEPRGAKQFPDGAWWVDLAPVTDPDRVPQALAAAAGLSGLTLQGQQAALTKRLQRRRALVVIDNCEHLAAACEELCDGILPACPGLVILATSRIGLRGGHEFALTAMESHAVSRRPEALSRRPAPMRSRCSMTGRAWCCPDTPPSPATRPPSPPSVSFSTGYRWPSSWLRLGSGRCPPPTCWPISTAVWRCWRRRTRRFPTDTGSTQADRHRSMRAGVGRHLDMVVGGRTAGAAQPRDLRRRIQPGGGRDGRRSDPRHPERADRAVAYPARARERRQHPLCDARARPPVRGGPPDRADLRRAQQSPPAAPRPRRRPDRRLHGRPQRARGGPVVGAAARGGGQCRSRGGLGHGAGRCRTGPAGGRRHARRLDLQRLGEPAPQADRECPGAGLGHRVELLRSIGVPGWPTPQGG